MTGNGDRDFRFYWTHSGDGLGANRYTGQNKYACSETYPVAKPVNLTKLSTKFALGLLCTDPQDLRCLLIQTRIKL